MLEIVINRCPRGTLLSEAGKAAYLKRKGLAGTDWEKLDRADPDLAELLRSDLETYQGRCAHIAFIPVPEGSNWKVMRRGKMEWVALEPGHG